VKRNWDGGEHVRHLHLGGSSPTAVVVAVAVAVEGEGGDGEELTGMAGMARSDLLRRLQPSCVLPSTNNEFMR
jgi:hypothetical protein